MTVQISNAFTTHYQDQVKQAYQGESRLMGTIRTHTDIEGSVDTFPLFGKGMAQPSISQAQRTLMNVAVSTKPVTLTDWEASDLSAKFDEHKINFDQRKELVKVGSSAIGRRMDQMVIDAMYAAGTTNTVAKTIGTNAALDMTKWRNAIYYLDDKGVPGEDRHSAISAAAYRQILGSTQATSSDFQPAHALHTGSLPMLVGVTLHVIETRAEGGLELAGTDRTLLIWHKDAVGLSIGVNMKTIISIEEMWNSALIATDFSAGAVGIDPEGIVEVTVDESVVIT